MTADGGTTDGASATEGAITPEGTRRLRDRIGSFGFWVSQRLFPPDDQAQQDIAAQVEQWGIRILWLGSSPAADLDVAEQLLGGSSQLLVGTSIANIWTAAPEDLAASWYRLDAQFGDRFVLGVGAGHAPTAASVGRDYSRPLAQLTQYLDALDAAVPPVPPSRRMLAALGPKALALSADRSAGALPYLTTPEHTRQAREELGPIPVLIPEHKVVLSADPEQARTIARGTLAYYLKLPNYLNSWRRLGFGDDDFTDGGSDRLVDAVVAHGDLDAITARLLEHLDAGADQVAVQVLAADGGLPLEGWQALASVLTSALPG